MDRPNLRSQMHSGADYVTAWDHIRGIFAAAGVHNAAWVWCPTANGFGDGQAAAFYPGDNEVDWICADAYPDTAAPRPFASTVDGLPGLGVALRQAGDDRGVRGAGERRRQQRAQWLRAAQQVVLADRQIKALLYFDANPAGQGPQGSYSLAGDAAALSAFRAIAAQPYFNPAVTGDGAGPDGTGGRTGFRCSVRAAGGGADRRGPRRRPGRLGRHAQHRHLPPAQARSGRTGHWSAAPRWSWRTGCPWSGPRGCAATRCPSG